MPLTEPTQDKNLPQLDALIATLVKNNVEVVNSKSMIFDIEYETFQACQRDLDELRIKSRTHKDKDIYTMSFWIDNLENRPLLLSKIIDVFYDHLAHQNISVNIELIQDLFYGTFYNPIALILLLQKIKNPETRLAVIIENLSFIASFCERTKSVDKLTYLLGNLLHIVPEEKQLFLLTNKIWQEHKYIFIAYIIANHKKSAEDIIKIMTLLNTILSPKDFVNCLLSPTHDYKENNILEFLFNNFSNSKEMLSFLNNFLQQFSKQAKKELYRPNLFLSLIESGNCTTLSYTLENYSALELCSLFLQKKSELYSKLLTIDQFETQQQIAQGIVKIIFHLPPEKILSIISQKQKHENSLLERNAWRNVEICLTEIESKPEKDRLLLLKTYCSILVISVHLKYEHSLLLRQINQRDHLIKIFEFYCQKIKSTTDIEFINQVFEHIVTNKEIRKHLDIRQTSDYLHKYSANFSEMLNRIREEALKAILAYIEKENDPSLKLALLNKIKAFPLFNLLLHYPFNYSEITKEVDTLDKKIAELSQKLEKTDSQTSTSKPMDINK